MVIPRKLIQLKHVTIFEYFNLGVTKNLSNNRGRLIDSTEDTSGKHSILLGLTVQETPSEY